MKNLLYIFLGLSLMFGCSDDSKDDTYVPVVGDYVNGGIVFWTDPTDNSRGLVCAIEDQSNGMQWNNGSTITSGASGVNIGSGAANTDQIIYTQGTSQTDYPAALARSYNTIEGYSDWFLPSRLELNEIYLNKSAINYTAIANGGSELAIEFYWSSTPSNAGVAYIQNFEEGNEYQIYAAFQDQSCNVRAVRAY